MKLPFDLYYSESGNPQGLPLIFLHAFPLDHSMWDGQAQHFKDYRIIQYDLRGLGKSKSPHLQLSLEDHVDDLLKLQAYLEIEQAIWCGLSMGGYIALRAVEKYPERCKALILCDTRSEADNNEGKLKRIQGIRTVLNDELEGFAKKFASSLLSENTLKNKPEVEQKVREMILAQSPEAIASAQFAMLSRTDTTSSLSKINVPTLIIVGEKDSLIPPSLHEEMQKQIPHAILEILPEAGHLSNLEEPALFNEKMSAFLKNL